MERNNFLQVNRTHCFICHKNHDDIGKCIRKSHSTPCKKSCKFDSGKSVLEQRKLTEKSLYQEKEKIYADLMKVADDGEYEDMRREIIRYFQKNK